MNARERAEKILAYIRTDLGGNLSNLDFIASQIEEAVLDDRMIRTADELYKLSYGSGFKAGLEEAKKLCGTCLYEWTNQGNKHKSDGHMCEHLLRVFNETRDKAAEIGERSIVCGMDICSTNVAEHIREMKP